MTSETAPIHPGSSDEADAVRALASSHTVEVTPREVLRHPGLLRELLRPDTSVFITYLANASFEDTVAAVGAVRDQGLDPVPHLAARSVPDLTALDRAVGELTGAGAEALLVIAGSLADPAGEIHESMQVLDSGVLQRHDVRRVGVAGHPEGNQDIGVEGLSRALVAKNRFAAETGIGTTLVTQFCFAAEPIVAWERQIRLEGNRLPVNVGLPGLSSPAKLLKFGLSCGVGPSLKVLRKQSGSVLRLATTPVHYPDRTLVGLARARLADPGSLLHGVHFFPFGALEATCRWLDRVASGDFDITGSQRLEMTS